MKTKIALLTVGCLTFGTLTVIYAWLLAGLFCVAVELCVRLLRCIWALFGWAGTRRHCVVLQYCDGRWVEVV